MENELILEGTLDKRYVVIVHQHKVQKYGFFDTLKECFNWWQNHKEPFFENDRPKGWGFGFNSTYDLVDDKLIEWNKLWLNEEIVDNCVKNMKLFILALGTHSAPQ